MNLEIVIPTKGRITKLEKTVNSIFHSASNIPISLVIYFSLQQELDYVKEKLGNISNVSLEIVYNYRVPEFWNSCLHKTDADALCYLNDDILLLEDTLEIAMKEFEKTFPNYDGVLGLRQINLPKEQKVEGAFGIIGKKYTERFPDGQVFCPDYDRFYCDHELWKFANSINKFYFCSTARIEHLYLDSINEPSDKTHKEGRKYWEVDNITYEKRKTLNYLWGKSFELINI